LDWCSGNDDDDQSRFGSGDLKEILWNFGSLGGRVSSLASVMP